MNATATRLEALRMLDAEGAKIDAHWRQWVQEGRGVLRRQVEGAPYVPRKKTDEEVRAELRARQAAAEMERRVRDARAAELAAQKKAEALLLSVLTEEQRSELSKRRQFFVTSKSGKRYRIDRHTHGNVYELNELGNPVRRLCAQPPGVPVDDAIAAQKLMLETDEAAFLRVANATRL
jgi:hypothetical protein